MAGSQAKPPNNRLRLVVLTDISSLEPNVREPDDGQSLIRLLLYANEFEIEGLIASSNMGHGQQVRPELIRQAIEAYGQDRPNLLKHDKRYPAPEYLLARVKAGQPVADRNLPVFNSIGHGKDTDASEWIIRVVDRPDPRPVWILTWGGSADLAQALWKVRETRTAMQLSSFVKRIRVRAVNDQDSTAPWIKREFPELYYITHAFSIRGMYRGGDESLSSPEWVERNVKPFGALGKLYPNYDGGDIWGRVKGVKEGDTPSFLALIPIGLNDSHHPGKPSWGGRFEQEAPNRWRDAVDPLPAGEQPRKPEMATVYRWRLAFQADFARRLRWLPRND